MKNRRLLPLLLGLFSGLCAIACCLIVLLQQNHIPIIRYQAARTEVSAKPSPSAAANLIKVNTASLQELQTLPGIGEKLAKRIIREREIQPFRFPEDLKAVNGIGDKKLEALLPLIQIP